MPVAFRFVPLVGQYPNALSTTSPKSVTQLPQYGAPKAWTKPEVLKIALPVGASKTLFIKENQRQTRLRDKPPTGGMNYALYLPDRSGTASHRK